MYYYELHCHTSVGSACSRQTPEELIACYAGAGYRGVVLTDHFGRGNTAVPRELPWAEQMQRFFSAADRAKAAARAFGMEVHFAVEFGLPDDERTAHTALLTYGIAVLENLDLSAAPDGDYTLFAAPLKIGGAEGAPCRAILVR